MIDKGAVLMDESIYKEFMCFDRTVYYILKNWYQIDFAELLFLDRYMGFHRNKEWNLVNNLDGLSNMIFSKGILENRSIAIWDLEKFVKEQVEPKGYKAFAVVNLFYPDKEKPFPYTSYMVIESFDDDYVKLTKLSNVEQKIKFNEDKSVFMNMLTEVEGNAEIYVFKDVSALKEIDNIESSAKYKYVMNNLYEYDRCFLKNSFDRAKSVEDEFAKTALYHKERIEDYLSKGIERSKYSHFVRRLGEMVFPSFICYESMKHRLRLEDENQELERSKVALKNEISMAQKNILAFIWTKDIKLFDSYLTNMNVLDAKFNEYRKKFHDVIMNQI